MLLYSTAQLFVSLRSQVAPHLYEDVLPCLQWLREEQGVRVAVLTNGNANLTSCNVLAEFIEISIGRLIFIYIPDYSFSN